MYVSACTRICVGLESSFGDLAARLTEQSSVLRIRYEKGGSVEIDGDGGHRDLHGSVADQAGPGAGGAGACGVSFPQGAGLLLYTR